MGMIEKLELLMNEHGLSKAELSRQARIPYTTIDGFWKRGTDNLQRSSLLKLAKCFNCTLDYLADDAIDINNELFKNHSLFLQATSTYSPHEQELLRLYRELDDDGREIIDKLIHTLHEQRSSKLTDKSGEAMIG